MAVKEIKEGKFSNGYIVAHLCAPRGYLKEDGKTDGDAWLPEIVILKPEKGSSIDVQLYSYILAKSPAKIYAFAFEPSWRGIFKLKNPVFTFREGFVPDPIYPEESKGDLVVHLYNLTGDYDKFIQSGSLPYSSDINRRIILHGAKRDLEAMLKLAIDMPVRGSYDLEFSAPCCANGKKKYTFDISFKDIFSFAKISVEEVNKLVA